MVSPNPFQENRLGKGKKTRNQIVSPLAKGAALTRAFSPPQPQSLFQAPARQSKQPISYAAHYRRAGQFRQLLQIRRSIAPRNQSKRPRACARPPGKLAAFFCFAGRAFRAAPRPFIRFSFLAPWPGGRGASWPRRSAGLNRAPPCRRPPGRFPHPPPGG